MNEIEAVGAEAASTPLETNGTMGRDRPWLFALLIAPSAVLANGVVQGGVLSYLLRDQGIGTGRQAHIIWMLSLPTMIYFLWSPITDFLLRRRTWLLLGSVAAGALMAAAFHATRLDSRVALTLMFLGGCCTQLVVSSAGGMMGAFRDERSKRVACGFYQGGGLGFGAAAVFVLITANDKKMSQSMLGLLAAALIAVPGLFALAAPKQEVVADPVFVDTMRRIWAEFKTTFLRWKAIPYTLCMVFPIASGAAVGLLPGVARDYGVNGEHVAWVNGVGGALLMAGGSLTATLIPARIRASVAYLTIALLNSATLGVLWLGPLRPATYYVGLTLYLFTIGTAYALFTAVVLEFLGSSGKSGSGRYSIINSLGNVPVLYMIAFDGWGGEKWGSRGLSGTEAVAGAVGATILLTYFLTRKRSRPVVAGVGAEA